MMKYDTIVIAGTTESREVTRRELAAGHRVLACVATELGADMFAEEAGQTGQTGQIGQAGQAHGRLDVHTGRLDEDGFIRLFTEHPCDKIIDASHPFAKIVTETVKKAADRLSIPYERYERSRLSYDYEQIIYVADAMEAARLLNEMEGNVLLTTGVNTAGLYAKEVKEAAGRLYIRVLDNEASRAGCARAGYPADHVFSQMPPFSVEDNLRLIRQTGASVLVTKDSGKSGGVDVKMEACRQAGIRMIMIRRPADG